MLNYKYEARNTSTGQKIRAQVQAESDQAAAKLIRQQGLVPLEITLDEAATKGFGKLFNKVRAKDRVLFSRQLSTLINAGLPLVQSLHSVVEQTQSKPLKVVINEIITDVEAGTSLAAAMGKHPQVFNRVYISLISAGEASGTLDKALERVADQQEKDAEILGKVRGAMIYPLIVLLVMVAVVIFMVVKVLPQVQSIYTSIPGAHLPFITKVLLDFSHFIIKLWWVAILILGLLIFGSTKWVKTVAGRSVVDKLKMRMWPVSQLFMKLYMARFARTGTTLVASGVPLIQMMDITGEAVNNVHIEDALRKAQDKVKGGKALSDVLKGDPNFLDLVPNMLHIGEQSGAMETMLEKIAVYYEKEVDNQIKAISTIIEPVLMVLMGIMALIIVAAILLPIYGLVGQSGFSNVGG
ncbi:MAG TPA: type II secretion system F family protein [Candidatus Saccharimonadales bacterium]|nr:type II secretion system F family protein [Candidatus Saccharimonadales bacterium]